MDPGPSSDGERLGFAFSSFGIEIPDDPQQRLDPAKPVSARAVAPCDRIRRPQQRIVRRPEVFVSELVRSPRFPQGRSKNVAIEVITTLARLHHKTPRLRGHQIIDQGGQARGSCIVVFPTADVHVGLQLKATE